jgi:hypothetical protein
MTEYIYATVEKTVGTLLVLCVKRQQAVVLLLAVVVVMIAMSESDGEISAAHIASEHDLIQIFQYLKIL